MTIPNFWHVGWTAALVNHLWQSTVVVLIAWLLAFTLRRNPARVRYLVWMVASLKFLIPFAPLAGLGLQWARPVVGKHVGSAVFTVVDEISQPFQQGQAPIAKAGPIATPAHILPLAPAVLVAVWLCGFITVLAVWFVRWRRTAKSAKDAAWVCEGREVDALRRAERNAGIRRPIPLRVSSRAMEPGVFGIFQPLLLWPAGISAKLDDAQIEAIAAHEVEHVRRRDNLTSALHMLVEALFWFHPAVRWMGARLVEERERACDEKVVEQSAHPESYAESILKVCAFCLEPPVACVSGVSGSDLKERVLRIMTHRSGTSLTLARKFVLAAVAMLAVALPVSFGVLYAMQEPAQLIHPPDGPPPTFEVVSIKPNHDPGPGRRIRLAPTGFATTRATLKDIIGIAYGIKGDDQLIGGPAWMNSDNFDVEAKESEADIEAGKKLSMEQRRDQIAPMIQAMLADRFGLKATIETRELPVYAMVVAKGGIKMKQVEVDPPPPPGTPPPPGAHFPRLMTSDGHEWDATAFPVHELTNWLSRFEELANHIVLDETGLTGNYDFVLKGVSPGGEFERNRPSSRPTSDEPATSIFTALQEQLGLKLETRKAPVEVLIIDHVERPSAN